MIAIPFTSHRIIKETDLDTFGHMNNAKYLSIFEEARWDWITQNGFGIKQMQKLGIGPTILEINLRFLKEIRLREQIEIESKVISYIGKIGKLQQKIIVNSETYCQAEFTVGLFDLHTRKLIQPTNEWLTAVGVSL
ncbi:MAG: acyl-CoA thioesterase [Gammaproteobacteria bacterium]|nr:acyl-CoA thioesterase [Gammaproteobacteria bacterium]